MPMPKTYNTPKRTFVVKTRLTEEEYRFFLERMKNYEMSQSEFIRQAIDGAVVKPIIKVCPVNDEVLAILGKLVAEYNKIGNSINQIDARANATGFIHAKRYEELVTEFNEMLLSIQEAVTKPEKINHGNDEDLEG